MHCLLKIWCLTVLAATAIAMAPATAERWHLPKRTGPTPLTSNDVPHIQIGVEPVPAISGQLLHRVSKIPGVQFRATIVRGATGFWLREHIKPARPGVIANGREFAHKHADGSLHASLSPKVATMAVQAGWAAHHPWAGQRPGWQGYVMIYTPTSEDELEVVFRLILEAYQFATGDDSSLADR